MSSRPPVPRDVVRPSANEYSDNGRSARSTPYHSASQPPVPPSSLPNSYDIPSLRRKPQPENVDGAAARHSRSVSHPFPSFFGGKRSDKKAGDNSPLAGSQMNSGIKGQVDGPGGVNRRPSQPRQQISLPGKANQQPVTGKCMTCDGTVRWPQDVRVYRCTTCLTITDLDSYEGHDTSAGVSRQPSVRKPMPVSVDKTRILIDHCLNEYMNRLLDSDRPMNQARHDAQETLMRKDDTLDTTHDPSSHNSTEQSFLQPTRPRFGDRTLSDSRLNMTSTRSREEQGLQRGGPVHTTPLSARIAGAPDQPLDARPSPARPDSISDNIFRTVESYVAGCFTGCAPLNMSFVSAKPPSTREVKGSEKGYSKQQPSESNVVSTSEPDINLSELDAKMLLVGDVAENGSWWMGNRALKEDSSVENARERSPERRNKTVTVKSPRINWSELAEWYRLIIHAGDDWRSKWTALRSSSTTDRQQRWHSISEDQLQRDIAESQKHLQRSLLKATENLLKRPRQQLKSPDHCRFLLMLLTNPLLHPSMNSGNARTSIQRSSSLQSSTDSTSPAKVRPPHPIRKSSGTLGHHSGIIKRVFGLLANLSNDVHLHLISWFSRLSNAHFQRLVDMTSSFVTHRLTRQLNKPVQEVVDPTAGLIPSFADTSVRHASQLHAAIGGRSNSSTSKKQDNKPKVGVYSEDWQIRAAARVMALLFQGNAGHTARKRDTSISPEQRARSAGMNAKHNAHIHGQMIPISNFYNTILDSADLVADFETWETTKSKFTFCQYPFFLSIWAKIHILEHDARRQMESKAREAFFDSILSRKAVSQYLVLKVRRDCLVEDSLKNVSEVIGRGGSDIKKGLRIDFAGEEGVDAGGLRKEWFLLLVREIFNPDHGLFVYDEDSQYCYFNPFCFESSEQFFLVGVLLGLAIYNSTILDIAFPPFIFKKMLASAPPNAEKLTSMPKIVHHCTLEDLAELHPTLARGLRQLLDFDGDVQEVFCRDFVAELDRYGEAIQVPLCSGGQKRAVTNSNRREFVDLYVHYLLDVAVARQYEPFKRGFFTVCGGNALSLFRPEEIELLVRGSDEPLDVSSLRAVATYDGWPKNEAAEEQPQVVWLWEFFQRVSPADQRKILSFVTGSDRIPAMGTTNLHIRVQLLLDREADEAGVEPQRFPIARTCFNQLGLYSYWQRETLEHKLWMAVTGSEGFGLK